MKYLSQYPTPDGESNAGPPIYEAWG